jgi:Tfp pilus assembly protein PilX
MRGQRGATLIIGLIMIVLITLVVVNAFMLSSSNLKSVGNMQVRDEAVAAANEAIELVVSSAFTNAPTAQTINVDINKDGVTDYVVEMDVPVCTRVSPATPALSSHVELGAAMSTGTTWNTDWDLQATVTDVKSGAVVKVHQGVRALLTQVQKTAVCN